MKLNLKPAIHYSEPEKFYQLFGAIANVKSKQHMPKPRPDDFRKELYASSSHAQVFDPWNLTQKKGREILISVEC